MKTSRLIYQELASVTRSHFLYTGGKAPLLYITQVKEAFQWHALHSYTSGSMESWLNTVLQYSENGKCSVHKKFYIISVNMQ